MTTTNNAPISFRLTDEEMELLKQYQEDGEKSLNLTAKRLLLSALGVDVKKSSLQLVNTVDINQVKELVDLAVQEKITELTKVDSVDNLKRHEVDQLINDRIKVGLEDGGDINSFVYKLVDNVNNSVNHVYSELQELKAAIPPVPVKSPESPPGEDVEAGVSSQEAGENLTAGGDGEGIDSDRSPTPNPSPNADFLDKPTIMLHDGSILVVSEKQEKILILLGLIPQTHNILTSQFLGAVCKSNLTTNKEELESLVGEKIDSKGSIIRKTAAVLRGAGFVLSGGESKGFKIIGVK